MRDSWPTWIERWQPPHRDCLKARVERPEESNDPCLTAPDAKYRAQENQLYRVEIHQGGSADDATFKWSRDNGTVVSRVTGSGAEWVAEKPLGFAAKNWVELSSDGQELQGQPGTLVKLFKVEGDRLTLEQAVPTPKDLPNGEEWPTKARRWDGVVSLKEGLQEANWIELENGIQIQFVPAHNPENRYRPGDHWLIPARVATGNIEWSVELDHEGKPKIDLATNKEIPIAHEPHGILHHYAPLAILTADGTEPEDCRCHILPLKIAN